MAATRALYSVKEAFHHFLRQKSYEKNRPRWSFHHERSAQQAREGEKAFVRGSESKYQSYLLQLFKLNITFHGM